MSSNVKLPCSLLFIWFFLDEINTVLPTSEGYLIFITLLQNLRGVCMPECIYMYRQTHTLTHTMRDIRQLQKCKRTIINKAASEGSALISGELILLAASILFSPISIILFAVKGHFPGTWRGGLENPTVKLFSWLSKLCLNPSQSSEMEQGRGEEIPRKEVKATELGTGPDLIWSNSCLLGSRGCSCCPCGVWLPFPGADLAEHQTWIPLTPTMVCHVLRVLDCLMSLRFQDESLQSSFPSRWAIAICVSNPKDYELVTCWWERIWM